MRFIPVLAAFLLMVPLQAAGQHRFDFVENSAVEQAMQRLTNQSRTRLESLEELNRLLEQEDSIRTNASQRGLFYFLYAVQFFYQESSRPEMALPYANEALGMAEKIEAPKFEYLASRALAGLYESQKMYNQSDYYLALANAAAEASGLLELKYDVTISEATILFARSEYEKVVELLRGYKLTTVTSRVDSMFRADLLILDGISKSYLSESDAEPLEFADALRYLGNIPGDKADELRTRIYGSMGLFHLQNGNFGKAITRFQELLQWAQSKQDLEEEMHASYHLGRAFYFQKKFSKSEDFYRRSLRLADSLGSTPWQKNTLEQLYQMARERNDPMQALVYIEELRRIDNQLISVSTQQQALEMQALYDLNSKENRIKLLEEASARQVLMQYGLIGGILLLIVILVLIVRLNMQQRQANLQLERKNDEIAQQKQRLQELNDTKNRLFSIIGHDLRGPVGNLRTFLEMLDVSYEDLSQKEYHEIVETAKRSATSTYTLLNTLLDWATHQMGETKPVMEDIRLLDVVQEAELFLMGSSRIKNIRVTKHIESDAVVLADKNCLATVVRNLLANAIKYTPEGGRIHITTTSNDGKRVLSISDSGLGIPKELKGKLFKEKVSSRVGTGNEIGSGLGLFVCRSLIEEIGGEIWIDSEENVGTTAHIGLKAAGVEA